MKNMNNYEWVKLPSKGQCYPIGSLLREGKVKVGYLTAMDENIIFSEKKRSKNLICFTLLNKKVLDSIDVSQLCSGDKEALILWIRKTNYGNLYTISDSENTIDLNYIHYKDFNMIGDENGYFSYITKNNNKLIYRLLPFQEEEKIIKETMDKLKEEQNNTITMEDIYMAFTKSVLSKMVVSIDDNKDREFIDTWFERVSNDVLRPFQRFVTYNFPGLENETTNGLSFDDSIFYDIK